MHRRAAQIVDIWTGRYSRDTAERKAARSAVKELSPAAVITGGSRGIGLEFARVFLAAGHTVVLVARDQSSLAAAVKSLAPSGTAKVFTIICDITELNCPDTISTKLSGYGCYLDILINNAAMGLSGRFDEQSREDIERLVSLNILALTRLTRHALPNMIARGQGGILNIASLGACAPGPYQAAYYASKAYVVSLTEAIASEMTGQGVRVCVVAPGPVNTEFHAAMGAETSLYRQILPALTPEQVAVRSYRWFTLGQRVIVPGAFNRLSFAALKLVPHPLSVPIVRWLLKNPQQ